MFNTIRKNQRALMLIVVILTILAFTFFYTRTSSIEYGDQKGVASIYGKVLTREDIQRLADNYQLAVVLELYDLLESLGGMARDSTAALNNFILNQVIIRHESNTLGVDPKDDQVARAISQLSIFQTNGQFDVEKYRAFLKTRLASKGIREQQLEDLVRDSLSVARIREIIIGSLGVSDQEIRNAFRGYQKQQLQVIKFSLSHYLDKVNVPEEGVKLLYEKESANLIAPEMRTVRYVVFELPKEKQSLEGKERIEAIQSVANQAATFAESLLSGKISLDEAAHQGGLIVNVSLPFDRNGAGKGAENLQGDLPKFAHAIFRLNEKQPYSDALEGSDKMHFYIFELASIIPSKQLTFEEARPQLTEALRKEAAAKLLYREGQTTLASIVQKLRSGQPIPAIAAETGAEIQELNDTSLYSSPSPEDALYNRVALFLSPGQASALQPSLDGAFAVFLQRRMPIDPLELAQKKETIKTQLLKGNQTLLFTEWLRNAQKRANIRINSN